MQFSQSHSVLTEVFGPDHGTRLRIKQAALVVLGIALLALSAKIRLPMWPVPATMQTFVILSIGASYGLRLGLVTIAGYLALGLVGLDVFTSSSATNNGLDYMLGATGGYLIGFVVATAVMGRLARLGWDRSAGRMVLAMLIGNLTIYAFGLSWMAWLFLGSKGAAWVLTWGMANFLVFDGVKLVLAALLFPTAWKLVGDARR